MASTVCGPALSTGTETPSPRSSALQSLLLTLAALAQIVLINSILSGNNALVSARAARHLPPPQGRAAMLRGGLVAVASYDGSVRVRDLATGGDSLGVVVTPDGKHAVVGGFQHALAVLDLNDLATADVAADLLCRWSELLSGQRLHEGGGTVNLSAAGGRTAISPADPPVSVLGRPSCPFFFFLRQLRTQTALGKIGADYDPVGPTVAEISHC
jgi:hypothetical protein